MGKFITCTVCCHSYFWNSEHFCDVKVLEAKIKKQQDFKNKKIRYIQKHVAKLEDLSAMDIITLTALEDYIKGIL